MPLIRLDDQTRLQMPSVVCLGFFDGVHIGHARLVACAKERASSLNARTVVHTFDRMPAKALEPEREIMEITPLARKAELLLSLGADVVAASPFDERMMRMNAEEFFAGVLLKQLRAVHIVAGFHHTFGYRGQAGVRELAALCEGRGVGLTVVPPVTLPDGELVSSRAVRALLASGDAARAAAMLGRSAP